jgi:hypothetical protein
MFLPVLLLATLASPSASPGSRACADFNKQLQQTYGFRPSQLDAVGRERRTKLMDGVWSAVRKNPATLGPCLESALKEPTQDSWFLFDGSQLLVSVDPSRRTKVILLDSLSRVSLDDADPRTWVELAASLGLDDLDTSDLGKRWLSYPKAQYSLPDHGGYVVDRGNGAMFIFGALDERYATPTLIKLTRSDSREQREIATWLLMSQATPEALRALSQINVDGLSGDVLANLKALLRHPKLIEPRKTPRTTRAQFAAPFAAILNGDYAPFDHLVETVPDGERDVVAVCTTPADLEQIRKVRRHFIRAANQHAIDYYNQFTQILMTLVWSPRLFEETPAKKP